MTEPQKNIKPKAIPKKKKAPRKKRKKLTAAEKEQKKLQQQQEREIRTLMSNIGFERVPGVDRNEFTYKTRTSEMDDIFYYENILLITEYTIGSPGSHLLKKNYFYNLVKSNPVDFIDFLLAHPKFKNFKEKFENDIDTKYTKKQIQVKILYCSKETIADEHKLQCNDVLFFDYHIVKYFASLAKVIKKSSRYEFFDFLELSYNNIGDNLFSSSEPNKNTYSGHILPEEHSSFKDGHKIVSFYIDANSLLKRAFVLRQNGWRKKENIGHYQRMFISSKIKNMRKYLHDKERVFINNIIATLSIDKVKLYDEKMNELVINEKGDIINSHNTKVTPTKIEILDETNIIGIIDGQHRTYAYHEGNDEYEKTIRKYRNIQNLLVTGILFPQKESEEKRLKFEANLFMEINANQSGASSQLKQEIELMINQFSTISISKKVLNKLNESGPISNKLEQFWYEKGKLKTASMISYGLRPLLKLDDTKSKDSIFSIWDKDNKSNLKEKECEDFDLLNEYISFAVETIRTLLIAFKTQLNNDKWIIDNKDKNAILTVTTINGIFNCLRFLIENNKISDLAYYNKQLSNLDSFDFKSYKSSQYRQMGEDLYSKYFKS